MPATALTPGHLLQHTGGFDRYASGDWHIGHQPGFYAFALRTARGHSWVAAFNSAPRDLNAFFSDLDSSLWAAARVTRWPGSNSKSSCET
jgi:hypothetical protein